METAKYIAHKIFLNLNSNIDLYIFVIALLALLFLNSKRVFKNSKSNSVLSLIMICVSSIIVFDTIGSISLDFKNYYAAIIDNISTTIQYVSIELLSLVWLYYVLVELELNYKFKKTYYAITILPTAFIVLTTISSPWTGLMFFIDDLNNYYRGPLYVLHASIPTIYLVISAIFTIIKYKKEVLSDKKDTYLQIFLYSVIPIIGGIIQVFNKGSNYFTLSVVISIDMLHLNSIKKDAILDPLTKLNNKIQFNSYLEKKVISIEEYNLYVLFFDMNNFKSVNDNFGHLEGDKAIITVSNVIKSTFYGAEAFCARCGGDEFGVVVEANEEQLHNYINNIHKQLEQISSKLPYILSVSIGYARFDLEANNSLEELIKIADNNMYENKEKMKRNHNLTKQPL